MGKTTKDLVNEFDRRKNELQSEVNPVLGREKLERQEKELLKGVHPVLADALKEQAYTDGHAHGYGEILRILEDLVYNFRKVNELLNSKQQSEVSYKKGLDSEALERAKLKAIQEYQIQKLQLETLRTLLQAKGIPDYNLRPPLAPVIVTTIVLIAQIYGLDHAADYVREHKSLT